MGSRGKIELFTSHTLTTKFEGGEKVYCTYPLFFDEDSDQLPYLVMSIDPDLPNLTCFMDWELYENDSNIAWAFHDLDPDMKTKVSDFIKAFGVDVYISWAEPDELIPDERIDTLTTILDNLEKEIKCIHIK